MSDKVLHDHVLGSTARWTAGVRAKESLREDCLFNDPWAAALAGKEGKEWAEHRSGDNGVSITVRTRFFDDFLQRQIKIYSKEGKVRYGNIVASTASHLRDQYVGVAQ